MTANDASAAPLGGGAPALEDVQRSLITAAARAVELGEHAQAAVLRAACQQVIGAYVQMGWATVTPRHSLTHAAEQHRAAIDGAT